MQTFGRWGYEMRGRAVPEPELKGWRLGCPGGVEPFKRRLWLSYMRLAVRGDESSAHGSSFPSRPHPRFQVCCSHPCMMAPLDELS